MSLISLTPDFFEVHGYEGIENLILKQFDAKLQPKKDFRKVISMVTMHRFCSSTHMASAKFLDGQLKTLKLEIKLLTQLLRGVEVDVAVHYELYKKKEDLHAHCVRLLVKFRRNLVSALEHFSRAKSSLESASWEHKSLQMYHEQVAASQKLDTYMAELIKVTMNRLHVFRSKAEQFIGMGENEFDRVNDSFDEVSSTSTLACTAEKIQMKDNSSCNNSDEGVIISDPDISDVESTCSIETLLQVKVE